MTKKTVRKARMGRGLLNTDVKNDFTETLRRQSGMARVYRSPLIRIILALTVLPPSSMAAQTAGFIVRDAASFDRAIAAINNDSSGGSYTITLNGSFTANPVTFTTNAVKTITIRGDGREYIISNNGGGSLFTIPKGVTLTLDNGATLDGNNKEAYLVSVESGTLIMKTGSMIRGAKKTGVYAGGTFMMQGGTISGNSNSENFGGGVWVLGTFTMSGGTISENSATVGGGVAVWGTFTMSGGTISNNFTDGVGGGVQVFLGTFTMQGGMISGNTASGTGGGGVAVKTGAFTMQGGTISRNSTTYGGGGVLADDGKFTMEGGTISGNSALGGGGVCILGKSTFIKRGRSTIDAANSAIMGKAVWVVYGDDTPNKERNSNAGQGVNMDSGMSGSAGGWE
jgi:hypothetical protein